MFNFSFLHYSFKVKILLLMSPIAGITSNTQSLNKTGLSILPASIFLFFAMTVNASVSEQIALLDDTQIISEYPLPDFSYAGYDFGLSSPPMLEGTVIDVLKYGAIADDNLDDSAAILKALADANQVQGPVVVKFPAGRFIISDIMPIERSNIVVRGAGKSSAGTILDFPRPLRMVDKTARLNEIRDYIKKLDKRQVEPANNVNLFFSEYSWSGGFFWIQTPDARPAPYMEYADKAPSAAKLTDIIDGQKNQKTIRVKSAAKLKVGDVIQLRWYSNKGKDSSILKEIYGDTDLEIGSHHWTYTKRPIVEYATRIEAIDGQQVTLATPLLHNINGQQPADIARWEHLTNVGIEDLAMVFPEGASFGHHLEQGYNGIYMTSVFNGWIRDVRFVDSESGVLTYDSANLTIANVVTEGERKAHYSVHIGNVHNVLVSDLKVFNQVVHPLSVNTQSTRGVFLRAELFNEPSIDQHAGANHENLFDQLTFHVNAKRDDKGPWYPVWDGSGAPYWQPGHGRYNTTWNLQVIVNSGAAAGEPVRLVGADEGPEGRVVGVHGNREFTVDYFPAPYTEAINQRLINVPSLYEYQLAKRKQQSK